MVDPNIALSYRSPQIQTGLDAATQAQNLSNMRTQQQLQQAQTQGVGLQNQQTQIAMQQMQKQNDLWSQAIQNAQGSPQGSPPATPQAGSPNPPVQAPSPVAAASSAGGQIAGAAGSAMAPPLPGASGSPLLPRSPAPAPQAPAQSGANPPAPAGQGSDFFGRIMTQLPQLYAQNGLGYKVPELMKSITDAQSGLADLADKRSKVNAAQIDAAGGIGAAVKSANYDPHLLLTLGMAAIHSQAIDANILGPAVQAVDQAIASDTAGQTVGAAKAAAQRFADNFIAQSPAQQKILSEATTADSHMLQAKTAADKQANEAPGQIADSDLKAKQEISQTLAAAATKGPAAYAAALGEVPQKYASLLPQTFDPATTPQAVKRFGMTPLQITQADQAAADEAERARHNTVDEKQGAARVGIEAQNSAINRARLGVEQYNAGLGPDGKPLQGSNLTGDAYLQTLPFAMQQRVKAIADGREPIPTGRAGASGQGKQLADAVTQYDPGFSTQRAALRSSFTTGSAGNNIGALNTAVVHLDQYEQAAIALRNHQFVPGNDLYNRIANALGSAPPTTAAGIANAVAGETATALKGVATDPEIANVKAAMPQNGSPDQIAAYARSQLHVLGAKLNAYDERYQAQAPGDSWSPVLPSARAVFQSHEMQPIARQQGNSPAPQTTPAAPVASAPAPPPGVPAGAIPVTDPTGTTVHWFASQGQAQAYKKMRGIQ